MRWTALRSHIAQMKLFELRSSRAQIEKRDIRISKADSTLLEKR
jgi:hypothetical protein